MERFINYLKATRGELKHVSWPTPKQALVYTLLVIVISVMVAFFLGFADFLFTSALNWFISR